MTASDAAKQLAEGERRIVHALLAAGGRLALADLATRAGFPSANEAYSAASWLRNKGLVEIEETTTEAVQVGPEGRMFLERGFPERRAHEAVTRLGGRAPLAQLRGGELSDADLSVALAWWKRKGLGTIEKAGGDTVLVATPGVRPTDDEVLLGILRTEGGTTADAARALNAKGFEVLRGRPGVLDLRAGKQRAVRLTAEGQAVAAVAATGTLLGELTPELITSGAWRGKDFQSYSLATQGQRPTPAKPHPLVQIIERIRDIFVELGFAEIEDEYVQSAFWNLDALFIPQDHPARDMQDTFYLEHPSALPVDRELLRTISGVHADGGGTGSRGWGRPLDPAESQRALLRTHTTVGTIRHLAHLTAEERAKPVRVFSIGRVFRHETMDATHLPEFHQVEGIATEEGADFPMLLGLLQEFFRRLGFPELRWRPAYFPYTEPSMEVEVWTGTKWLELGGCGIFRAEVTKPFGVGTPVLAWGLGLERLAMMRLGLKDIRDLYVSDVEWLRDQPLL